MIAHGAGMVEYLKRAFLYRWNLLLFFGGAAAAALSSLAGRIVAAFVGRGSRLSGRPGVPAQVSRCD